MLRQAGRIDRQALRHQADGRHDIARELEDEAAEIREHAAALAAAPETAARLERAVQACFAMFDAMNADEKRDAYDLAEAVLAENK